MEEISRDLLLNEPAICALTLAELGAGPHALAVGLPLYTCNPDDFAGIDELTVVALPVP